MLKHLSTRQPADHLRTPSNGLSESGSQSDHPPSRRLLINNNMAPHPSHQHHQLTNGYTSPGRYSTVGGSAKQQQQAQLHNVSMLNTSKHSLSPTTSVSPGTGANQTKTTLTNLDHSRDESLPFNFSNGPLSSSVFITDRSLLPNGNHTYLSNRWETVVSSLLYRQTEANRFPVSLQLCPCLIYLFMVPATAGPGTKRKKIIINIAYWCPCYIVEGWIKALRLTVECTSGAEVLYRRPLPAWQLRRVRFRPALLEFARCWHRWVFSVFCHWWWPFWVSSFYSKWAHHPTPSISSTRCESFQLTRPAPSTKSVWLSVRWQWRWMFVVALSVPHNSFLPQGSSQHRPVHHQIQVEIG